MLPVDGEVVSCNMVQLYCNKRFRGSCLPLPTVMMDEASSF